MKNILITFLLLGANICHAGSISLSWDLPFDLSNVIGYRVYHSTNPASFTNFFQITQANQSTFSLHNLPDCQYYYAIVRSYNQTFESGNSNMVQGYPRPRISSISRPNWIRPGEAKTFTFTGANFASSGFLSSEPGLTTQVTARTCTSVTFNVIASANATIGYRKITWENPDESQGSTNTIKGSLYNAIEVIPAGQTEGDTTPPAVLQADGAPEVTPTGSGIVTTTKPTVKFTESISRDSEGAIRLQDEAGANHPIDFIEWDQESIVAKIHLLSSLDYMTNYRIYVGSTLQDVAGNYIDSAFSGPLFQTEAEPDSSTPASPTLTLSGDEMTWNAISGVQWYEVYRNGYMVGSTRVKYESVDNRDGALKTFWHIAFDGEWVEGATVVEFTNISVNYTYTVRACKQFINTKICSPDSNPVNYVGRQFMCLINGVEIPCYEGAPLVRP